MELRRVGNTGLKVSHLGLGTIGWGRDTLPEEAFSQLELFLGAQGNLIDVAPSYGEGLASEILGNALAELKVRDQVIINARAASPGDVEGFCPDGSRAHLLRSLDRLLSDLRTDYVDIFVVSGHDNTIEVEETLSALEYILNSGKARYLGVSNYPSWALAEIASLGKGRAPIAVTTQEFSLLNRSLEAEHLEACMHLGVGIFAWSPLARGVLTGKYRATIPPDSRAGSSHLANFVQEYLDPRFAGVVEALCTAAQGLDLTPLEVALSWVCEVYPIASALIGPRTVSQLQEILKVEKPALPKQIRQVLNEVSADVAF